MTVSLSPVGGAAGQFFDSNGNPLAGGKLYSYAAGTTTPQITYTSATGLTANTNPIILNSAGRVPSEIWLTDGVEYKFGLYTAADQLIGIWDNISGINGVDASDIAFNGYGGQVGVVQDLGDADGSDWIGFTPLGAGSAPRTAQNKMRDVVNVKDFGAVADGVADDSAAVQAAINYCLTFDPPAVLTVSGLCRLDSTVNIDRATDAVTASTYFIIQGDGLGGGFYAYNGIVMFSTTLAGYSASQKVNFDNIVFKSEFPTNPAYVLDDAKFLRMRFTNCSFHRIKCLAATRYLQTYYFDNCTCYGWIGTFFDGTNGAYDIKFDNHIAEAGTTFYSVVCNDTYSADPNAQISITNSLFQSLTGAAVIADRAQGFDVDNCYFEGNGSNGAPDLKFDTTRNLANITANGAIKVTGCFFSQLLANFNDPNYYSIRWGRVTNGFATANYLVDLGTGASLKLSNTIPESRVVFLGDPGYAQGYFSEFVSSAGGYVMPGTGGERLKIIRGNVSSAGAISQGTGFTVTNLATGRYQIDAQTAFSAIPTIVASAADSGGISIATFTTASSTTTMVVEFRNAANAYTATAFSFIITGPA